MLARRMRAPLHSSPDPFDRDLTPAADLHPEWRLVRVQTGHEFWYGIGKP